MQSASGMDRVKGKVAIVTGGALGIGRSACDLLAREGATVAVADILDDEGARAAAAISDAGGTAAYWHLDVADEKEVEGSSRPSTAGSAASTSW